MDRCVKFGKKEKRIVVEKAVQQPTRFPMHEIPTDNRNGFWYPPLFPDFPHNVFIEHISINGGHDLAYLCVLQIEERRKVGK